IRDVPRRAVLANAPGDPRAQLLVERNAAIEDDEQDHPQLTVPFAPRNVPDQRVEHLLHRARRPVDLARAHAYALAVDRRVRAAVDDRAAAGGDPHPVAVAPNARVHREVALAVALPAMALAIGGVLAPEEQWHRRQRLREHQLADLVDQAVAVLVPGLDRAAEHATLQLAFVHRQQRAAADERGADVGAAAGREQPLLGAEVLVDTAQPPGPRGGAGGADRAQGVQVMIARGLDPGLCAR